MRPRGFEGVARDRTGSAGGCFQFNPWRIGMKYLKAAAVMCVVLILAAPAFAMVPRMVIAELGAATW